MTIMSVLNFSPKPYSAIVTRISLLTIAPNSYSVMDTLLTLLRYSIIFMLYPIVILNKVFYILQCAINLIVANTSLSFAYIITGSYKSYTYCSIVSKRQRKIVTIARSTSSLYLAYALVLDSIQPYASFTHYIPQLLSNENHFHL